MKSHLFLATTALSLVTTAAAQQIQIVNNGSWTVISQPTTMFPDALPPQSQIRRFNVQAPGITGELVGANSGLVGIGAGSNLRGVGSMRGWMTAGPSNATLSYGQPNALGVANLKALQWVMHGNGSTSGNASLTANVSTTGSASGTGGATGSTLSGVRIICPDLLGPDLFVTNLMTQSTTGPLPSSFGSGSAVLSVFSIETRAASVSQAIVPLGGGLQIINDVAATGTLTLQ